MRSSYILATLCLIGLALLVAGPAPALIMSPFIAAFVWGLWWLMRDDQSRQNPPDDWPWIVKGLISIITAPFRLLHWLVVLIGKILYSPIWLISKLFSSGTVDYEKPESRAYRSGPDDAGGFGGFLLKLFGILKAIVKWTVVGGSAILLTFTFLSLGAPEVVAILGAAAICGLVIFLLWRLKERSLVVYYTVLVLVAIGVLASLIVIGERLPDV